MARANEVLGRHLTKELDPFGKPKLLTYLFQIGQLRFSLILGFLHLLSQFLLRFYHSENVVVFVGGSSPLVETGSSERLLFELSKEFIAFEIAKGFFQGLDSLLCLMRHVRPDCGDVEVLKSCKHLHVTEQPVSKSPP